MDRHTQSRLQRERVIWLVTASKEGRPQAVPVWFLWDGRSFLVYAQDGAKVTHIRSNPYVELHLNSDEAGDDLFRASGRASMTNATKLTDPYVRKYRRDITDLDMTPASFVRTYHNAIRIREVKFH